MMNDPAIYGPMAGILAMAFATYVTRVAGFWLMGHVTLTLRVRRMLEIFPGAIVVATVVPLTVKAGMPGLIAVGVTLASMLIRRNEFLAVALGLTAISLDARFRVLAFPRKDADPRHQGQHGDHHRDAAGPPPRSPRPIRAASRRHRLQCNSTLRSVRSPRSGRSPRSAPPSPSRRLARRTRRSPPPQARRGWPAMTARA